MLIVATELMLVLFRRLKSSKLHIANVLELIPSRDSKMRDERVAYNIKHRMHEHFTFRNTESHVLPCLQFNPQFTCVRYLI